MNAIQNAPRDLWTVFRTLSWRVLIVAALAIAVSGATYAVAVSPVGTSMSSGARRPPGRPTTPEASTATDASAVAASTVNSGAVPAVSPVQATPSQRPQGGEGGPGRGPSLARGLPQLGMHAAVIAMIVLIFNGIRMLWQSMRRRRGGTRAPVFNHATMRR